MKVNDFPNGTTLDYLKNGSFAELNLPALSNVLYAELVWGGLYKSSATNISDRLNKNVNFGTPAGNYSIASDILTRQNIEINLPDISLGFYVRSANVTSIVKNTVNGTYSLSAVPTLIESVDSRTADTNHAGWTLAVVYADSNQPFRSLNLWAGGVAVSSNTGSTDIVLSGFKTPVEPSPSGKLFVSAQEGDAVIGGDQMLFGNNVSSLQNLSGANNPLSNFSVLRLTIPTVNLIQAELSVHEMPILLPVQILLLAGRATILRQSI